MKDIKPEKEYINPPTMSCSRCGKIKVVYEEDNICFDCWCSFKRVYMAGKISANDWRHDITNYKNGKFEYGRLRDVEYWEIIERGKKPSHELILDNDLIYAGPFFMSCDHGCSHGDATHGADNKCDGTIIDKSIVFEKCLEQIDNSDYVFCWLDSLDAYGTLFELGVAREKGKKIFLAIDKKLEPEDTGMCACGKTNETYCKCCHSGNLFSR